MDIFFQQHFTSFLGYFGNLHLLLNLLKCIPVERIDAQTAAFQVSAVTTLIFHKKKNLGGHL